VWLCGGMRFGGFGASFVEVAGVDGRGGAGCGCGWRPARAAKKYISSRRASVADCSWRCSWFACSCRPDVGGAGFLLGVGSCWGRAAWRPGARHSSFSFCYCICCSWFYCLFVSFINVLYCCVFVFCFGLMCSESV
jgi:hypothetical protein